MAIAVAVAVVAFQVVRKSDIITAIKLKTAVPYVNMS